MEETLCLNCGTLDTPVKKNKGSIGIEALLLILTVFCAALNLVLGSAIFVVFLVYCVWRLSTKHFVCAACESLNIIPADSPKAQCLLGDD